jgi:hypothetical protein
MHKFFVGLLGLKIYDFNTEDDFDGDGAGYDLCIYHLKFFKGLIVESDYDEFENPTYGDGADKFFTLYYHHEIFYGDTDGDGESNLKVLSIEGKDA